MNTSVMATSGKNKVLIHSSYRGMNGSQKVGREIADILCNHLGISVSLSSTIKDAEFLLRTQYNTKYFHFSHGTRFRQNNDSIISNFSLLGYFNEISRCIRCLRSESYSAVHLLNARGLFDVGISAWLAGIPIVWHQQSGLSNKLIGIFGLLLSQKVVVVSKGVKSTFDFAPDFLKRHLYVIYNGLNAPTTEVSCQPSKEVTFIGSVVPQKGLHVVIKALANLGGQNEVQVFGQWKQSWYTEYCENLAVKSDVKINRRGFVSDIVEIYKEKPLVIIPSIEEERFLWNFKEHRISWKEGFNLVALEAALFGCPVIASDSFGLKETAEKALRFGPGDHIELSTKIQVIKDTSCLQLQQMCDANRKYVEETFSKLAFQKKIVKLYRYF